MNAKHGIMLHLIDYINTIINVILVISHVLQVACCVSLDSSPPSVGIMSGRTAGSEGKESQDSK